MNSFWDEMLFLVHYFCVPGKRPILFFYARARRLTWRQMTEVYRLTRNFSATETTGFFDSVMPGSIENAMRMLRAVHEPAYFTSFVIDCRYAKAERDGDSRMRRASPLFGNGQNARSLGYEDVIMLSESGVTPDEAQPLVPYMSVLEVISCVRGGVPTDYAVRAAQAGCKPVEAWANGLPVEYLV